MKMNVNVSFSLPGSVEKDIFRHFRHNNDLHMQHHFQYCNKIFTQSWEYISEEMPSVDQFPDLKSTEEAIRQWKVFSRSSAMPLEW